MIKCDYWFPRGIWHKENCGLDTDHFNEFATVHRGAMSGRKASNEGGFQSFDWGSERMHTLTPLKHLSEQIYDCLLYTSPSPRDQRGSALTGCG